MATILPTGETQFLDANGDPLAAGTVTFYIPGTTTPKDTWQNAAQSILNSNPVTLDAAGRAIIYGSGAYRQVVKDQFGNLIWDQDTAEPNQGAVSFGGTSGGTANAQTLSAAQFSGIDGQIISFVAGVTNTGATTISVGGSSPIPVLKNSPAGPVALAAGDIIQGNSYFVQYSTALSAFQLLLSVAPAIPTGPFLRGYVWGNTLSNNVTDVVNDIDIAAGGAASDGATPVLMTLSSVLTKRADAGWAVGSGNGWLDTGSIANGSYFVFIIQRSDTGVVDSLLSLSPTAPTMPANYDRKRRIGAIVRAAGAIVLFTQNGDDFTLTAPAADRTSIAAASNILLLLSVPVGIKVAPWVTDGISANAASNIATFVGSGDATTATVRMNQTSSSASTTLTRGIYTNAAGQIRFSQVNTIGSAAAHSFQTFGWTDDRGRTS
jgi:hypothetical protein